MSSDTKTPVGGKMLQAFKKKVENIKLNQNTESELNMEWKKWTKSEGDKLLKDLVFDITQKWNKKLKPEEVIAGIQYSGGKTGSWVKTNEMTINGVKRETYTLLNDFVIDINIADDVDASKLSKKFKAWVNSFLRRSDIVYGSMDSSLQNIEITESGFVLNIDGK